MADAYLGEIRMFGGLKLPMYWLPCDGKELQMSEYEALFALIGTTYGGDGMRTFKLPDLRGRLPIGQGNAPSVTPRPIGQSSGSETVTLAESAMPLHTHAANASNASGTQPNPGGVWAATVNTNPPAAVNQYVKKSEIISPKILGAMDPAAVGKTGGGASHDNVMPYLPVNYMICASNGVFPQQN